MTAYSRAADYTIDQNYNGTNTSLTFRGLTTGASGLSGITYLNDTYTYAFTGLGQDRREYNFGSSELPAGEWTYQPTFSTEVHPLNEFDYRGRNTSGGLHLFTGKTVVSDITHIITYHPSVSSTLPHDDVYYIINTNPKITIAVEQLQNLTIEVGA
tara:strand:- start:135 stop:602 length:468 start_codon:yes stop_codon:yes gene_type:complete